MAAIANTLRTYDQVGTREDLSNIISNITPTDRPFSSNVGKRPRATQIQYDWQQHALANADTSNAQPEGDDITSFPALSQPTRVANVEQISRKHFLISDTAEVTDKAGRKSELAYFTAMKGEELAIDIEAICVARNSGADLSDPRKTATLLSYVRTNVDMDAAGANPAAPAPIYAGSRTDSATTRFFGESVMKNVIQMGYASGMKIDGLTIMVSPKMKQYVSENWVGIAPLRNDVGGKAARIVGTVSVYMTDFGTVAIVPNRHQRDRDAWFLDFDLIGFKDLRPYKRVKLAKTGDATKFMVNREWSLQVDNEAGLGLAADLKVA